MEFSTFLKYVPKIAKETLPAAFAHSKMIPPNRFELLNNQDYSTFNPRYASVLMLLYPKNKITHLVLILRNTYPGIHSSQIAFPGGKNEKEDASFAQTALRETHEEIGIPAHKITIIKPFTEVYIPPSNFLVSPFLGFSSDELKFTPNPDEVTKIIEISVTKFLDDSILTNLIMSTNDQKEIEVPAFQLDKHLVWGATAMMMSELKETLKSVF